MFTANQNLNRRNAAIYTRQNPGGARRGYECPEERDYYPYWRPSIWKDIAIYTNYPRRCNEYQSESQNVKNRWYCRYDDSYWDEILDGYVPIATGQLPITKELCDNAPEFIVPSTNETKPIYYWTKFDSWNIDPPECLTSSATRANHLGLIGGRSYYTYQWYIPDDVNSDSETCCVLRSRYNMTTNDYQAWQSESSIGPGLDYRNNSLVISPDPNNDPAWVKIWQNFKLSYDDIYQSFENKNEKQTSRGYVFVNNPHVDPFGHVFKDSDGNDVRMQLQLAINTNQFGRTFQDRTHCFQIKERPEYVEDGDNIILMTAQGKRGNIVQVFPATEYFFIPEPISVSKGDYVHFCWTGSNTNPENNDGQGRAGADRSNICPLTQQQYAKVKQKQTQTDKNLARARNIYSIVDKNYIEFNSGAVGDLGNNYPDYVEKPDYGLPKYNNFANKRDVTPSNMAGFDIEILKGLCSGRRIDDNQLLDYGNMEELDDAGTTVCVKPIQVKSEGLWNFLCTRNNNFSNRSQKGRLKSSASTTRHYSINSNGLSTNSITGEARLIVQSGMIDQSDTLNIALTTWKNKGSESTIVEIAGHDGGEFNSHVLTDNAWIEIWIPYTPKSLHTPYVNYKANLDESWMYHSDAAIEYDDTAGTYYAVVNVTAGGFYIAVNSLDAGMLIILLLFLIAFVGVSGKLIYSKCNTTMHEPDLTANMRCT